MADNLDDSNKIIPTSEDESQQKSVVDKTLDAKDKVDKIRDTADKVKKLKQVSSASKASAAVGTTGASAIGAAGTTGVAATGAAGASAAGVTTGASTVGVAAGGSIITIVGIIILVIVVLFLLIGIIVSLIYLPGSIGELVKGFFRNIGVYLVGEDIILGDTEFSEVANIIKNRGYDLYAEGYINDQLDPERDLNEMGEVIKLPKQRNKDFPHLIDLYTRMDAYTYRVRNIAKARFFVNQDMAGFLNFHVGTWENNKLMSEKEYSQGIFREGIQVRREEGILRIKRKLFGGVYNFQMDGWSGRYGLPLEIFVALHQGTRAPDLVREIAKGPKAYTSENLTEESIEYFDQRKEDILYYQKPILNILLLETTVVSTANFLVPETTTINGEVYVLKKEAQVGEQYNYNPFNFSDSDFELKSELTLDEVYNSYFKAPSGQYIRIKPKKKDGSSIPLGYHVYNPPGYHGSHIPFGRDSYGVLTVDPYERIEILQSDGTIKVEYKVNEETYDFSSLYFTLENGVYKVKNQSGTIIKSKDIKNANEFVDTYGLYYVVEDIIKQNNEVDSYHNFFNKINEISKETGKAKTYIPMIKNSENHWFRDIYFILNPGEQFVKEDKDYFLQTGEQWSIYNEEIIEDGKKVLTPTMETVTEEGWSAYEIKETVNPEDILGEPFVSSDEKYQGFSRYIFLHEDKTVNVTQKQEGRRGMTNARTKNLFDNIKWYKYDGTVERADKNNEDRAKPKSEKDPSLKFLIDSNTDLMAAFEILEGSRSLDAQYILRDLKELYVELGYFKKEDLRDPIRRILRWPLKQYKTPRMWPAADIHQDPEGYGVFIPSKQTLEEVYDEDTLKANEAVVGEGFEPDIDVLSPVTGKIEEIGVKDISRLITDKDGNLKKLIYKDVGYITISAIDQTAFPEIDAYKEFYENEYKGVIAGKVKHGKQAEDSRYIGGNKITIEGIKVEIPSNVNDESNSSYVRQIKNSDIKRIQDIETQEKAEAIEQTKIDAPNYISIAGSTNHIGDYIKEGTVIGKTMESDVRIIMQDIDKAFIENSDLYFVLDLGFYIEIMDDYYTKVEPGEPNVIEDVDLFREILSGYPILQENAQIILDMQEKYGVNAFFIAAVAIQECSGGNATTGLNHAIRENYGGDYNNIFSIKGTHGGGYTIQTKDGPATFNLYSDYESAFEDFAKLISNPTGYYWGQNKYFVSEIGDPYCVPPEPWIAAVNGHITRLLEKAQIQMYGSSDWYSYGDISDIVAAIIAEAHTHIGKPYVWGGNGPNSFDCSGLVKYIFDKLQIVDFMSRTATPQYNNAPMKTRNYADGQPGDLIFFHSTVKGKGPNDITHVGIYLGNDTMIHAGSPESGVKKASTISYFGDKFYGFARYVGVSP